MYFCMNMVGTKVQYKGSVSPDIAFCFCVCEIKSALSAGLLMILTHFYFIVSEIFKIVLFIVSMKTLILIYIFY
jgi:hypothetical protein